MEGSSSVDSPKVMEELKSSMTSKEYWELKQTIESGKKAQAKLENILDHKPKSTRQSPTIPYESAARGPRTMEGSRKIPYEFKESQQTMEGSSSGTNKDVGRAARLKRMRKNKQQYKWAHLSKVEQFIKDQSTIHESSSDPTDESEGDVLMKIKFNRGSTKAYVDFSHPRDTGYTGPFDIGISLGQLLQHQQEWKTDSDSSESESEEDEEVQDIHHSNSECSDDDDDDLGEMKPGIVNRTPELSPTAGAKDTCSENPPSNSEGNWMYDHEPDPKVNDCSKGAGSVHSTLFKLKQLVYYYDPAKNNYWVGVVRGIRTPNARKLQMGNVPVMPIVWYAIEPEGEGKERLPNVIIKEKDLRSCLSLKRVR
jgi:hypothetical protein